MNQGLTSPTSDLRESGSLRAPTSKGRFLQLRRRAPDDPMRLRSHIQEEVDAYFLKHGLTCLSGQKEALYAAIDAVLQAEPESCTVIPFEPGLGKSTLIRAMLTAFAQEFRLCTSIALRIGGVIVVVEKSSEAHELENLCNSRTTEQPVAVVIEGPNDYNLGQGGCYNGQANSFQECPRRACPDYAVCPLANKLRQTQETPILILLHARYQSYIEDISGFLTWYREDQEQCRSLLLIDELPNLFEENIVSLKSLNEAELELDSIKPSYTTTVKREKLHLLFLWDKTIRLPFRKFMGAPQSQTGLVSIEDAGFNPVSLQELLEAIECYSQGTKAQKIVKSLLDSQHLYYYVGQTTELFAPRLKKIAGKGQPATFIFSGTAQLSPEVMENSEIQVLESPVDESFERMEIVIQRGDAWNASKTGLKRAGNLNAAVQWLQEILPDILKRHNRVLLVSYQTYAEALWSRLDEFHSHLIPYVDGSGKALPKLPYFGGLNGSNLYQAATCVISLGLNRFEPREYIGRALALNSCGDGCQLFPQDEQKSCRLDRSPRVMEIQDITLARDLVQLIFRSALRRHGETAPIEVWLLQPPNGVVAHLQNTFPGCRIREIPDFSVECKMAASLGKRYCGQETSAGKLLRWLLAWDGSPVSPEEIRHQAGLTLTQFKEAKRNPNVRAFFQRNIHASGSGRNTIYVKNAAEIQQ